MRRRVPSSQCMMLVKGQRVRRRAEREETDVQDGGGRPRGESRGSGPGRGPARGPTLVRGPSHHGSQNSPVPVALERRRILEKEKFNNESLFYLVLITQFQNTNKP